MMVFDHKLFAAARNGKHEALSELITSLQPSSRYRINVTSQVMVKSILFVYIQYHIQFKLFQVSLPMLWAATISFMFNFGCD